MRMRYITPLGLVLLTAGCGETSGQRTGTGATGGAVAGAVVGGPVGAVVGAGVGAAGGAERHTLDEKTDAAAQSADRYVSGKSGSSSAAAGAGTANARAAANNPTSQDVRQVQSELKDLGFYKGRVDGIYGPRTTAAVNQFQAQHKLAQTGRLDDPTRQQLQSVASARGAPPPGQNNTQTSQAPSSPATGPNPAEPDPQARPQPNPPPQQ